MRFSLKFTRMKRKSDEEWAFDKTLAQIIQARRSKLKLSQLFISIRSGVSRITIGKWETGEKTPIAYDLYNVLKVLYKNPSEFWNDFYNTFEKSASPIREAADKKKYLDYIAQSRKNKAANNKNVKHSHQASAEE